MFFWKIAHLSEAKLKKGISLGLMLNISHDIPGSMSKNSKQKKRFDNEKPEISRGGGKP